MQFLRYQNKRISQFSTAPEWETNPYKICYVMKMQQRTLSTFLFFSQFGKFVDTICETVDLTKYLVPLDVEFYKKSIQICHVKIVL